MIYDVKAYLHGLRDTYREEIQSGPGFLGRAWCGLGKGRHRHLS